MEAFPVSTAINHSAHESEEVTRPANPAFVAAVRVTS
jgi:hypothetical protein